MSTARLADCATERGGIACQRARDERATECIGDTRAFAEVIDPPGPAPRAAHVDDRPGRDPVARFRPPPVLTCAAAPIGVVAAAHGVVAASRMSARRGHVLCAGTSGPREAEVRFDRRMSTRLRRTVDVFAFCSGVHDSTLV